MSRPRTLVLASGLLVLAACGGAGESPGSPSPPENPNQMVISASGELTPHEISITAGSRVLVTNNHSRPHFFASDPHPEHDACPDINQVGLLAPGQRRETGNLVTIRTCGVHDHDDPGNAALRGRIVIR